jgi:tetratricopeptide (TPR) repeat protein
MMGRRPRATDLRLDRALVRLFGARFTGWLDLPTAVAFSSALAIAATLWFGMGWLIPSSPISDSKVTVQDAQYKEFNNAAEAAAEAARAKVAAETATKAARDKAAAEAAAEAARAKAVAETATKAARYKAAAEAEVKAARGKAAAEAKAARTNSAGDRLAQRAHESQTLLPPQSAAGKTAGANDFEVCDHSLVDPDAGIAACTRLLEHPSSGTKVFSLYNNRGLAKVRKGNLDDAIADFTSALNQNPKFVEALKNRGIARHMQGDYDAAIADFNRALLLDPKSPDLYNMRGLALFNKEEYDRAIEDFNKAISLDPNYPKAYVNRGLVFQSMRQPDRAIADFDMVVRLAPSELIGYTNRASVRMDKADLQGAIADYNEVIRLDPNNSGVYTRRGEAWRLQGYLERSLADHNKAIALNPNDKEAYNNRALTLKDQGKLDEAIADYGQAIMRDPAYDLAYANRGLIRRLKGDLGGSLADLNKAVTLNPRSPVALTFRGDTLRESGDNDRALADFNKAILILPDFVAAYTGRGLTYEKKGDLAKAKEDFEKALSLPADVDAGLARPAQEVARTRRFSGAARKARAKAEADERGKAEVAKLVPDEIRQLVSRRGHALLIGVSDYKTGWNQLPSVKNDLVVLKEELKSHFETVEAVQSPTVAELTSKIKAFLLETYNKPTERLFIYYSGHGFTDYNEASRQNDGYITGIDTPVHKLGKPVAKAVPFADVDSWNRQTHARHVLMVFDSCFSASLFQIKAEMTEPNKYEFDGIRSMLGKPIRYFITACRQNEEVAADSTFAKSLLHGLRGDADVYHEGIISAEELGTYLLHAVHKLSDRQTPQFGSIAFAKPTPPPQTVETPKPVHLLRDKAELVEAVAQVVLTALPLVAFLTWLGIRWNRRSLWLERRVTDEVPELDSIRLPRESRWLFTDAGFRSAAQNLRRHRRAAATDLHIKQTIEATVQRAGLFIPVYKDRQLTPEYLFLIEEVSADDHVARFGDEALDRLEEEGVAVERVYFSRDPRLCFRNDVARTPISLTELAARTTDHRLVVIGTADSFFHMASGRPERWLSTLELWATRVMLSSLPLRSWSTNELALLERGFSLATTSPKGFEALGDYISAVEEAPGGELLEGTLVTR